VDCSLTRAALYVDGFNLYHAINDLRQPCLKWLNLWALGALLIPQRTERLVKVAWCTAVSTKDHNKLIRHRQYIRALKASNVTILVGHFADEQRHCRSCGNSWTAPVEKQGDVNLALALLDDACRDIYDHAYLLTADSDQAGTARLFRERYVQKRLTSVSPPGRSHSKEILSHCHAKIAVSATHLERALFPKAIIQNGAVVAIRPSEYDPPQ
jgi:hypothetical protein